MKLLEQVRIDLEEIQRRGIGQRRRFHEAQQREEIVEVRGLPPELALVGAERHAAQHFLEMLTPLEEISEEVVGPGHFPTIIFTRTDVPPRFFSLASFDTPSLPRISGTYDQCTSPAMPIQRWSRTSTPPSMMPPA